MPFFQNKSNFKLLILGLIAIGFICLIVWDKINQTTYDDPVVQEQEEEVNDCLTVRSRDKFTGAPTRMETCFVGRFARVKIWENEVLQLDFVCEHNAAMNTCELVTIHYATPEVLERIQRGEKAKEKYEQSMYRPDI